MNCWLISACAPPSWASRPARSPVTRAYPATGATPTKISGFKGNSDLLKILFATLAGKYNP